MLHIEDLNGPLVIETKANDYAIAVVLVKDMYLVAFAHQKLT